MRYRIFHQINAIILEHEKGVRHASSTITKEQSLRWLAVREKNVLK